VFLNLPEYLLVVPVLEKLSESDYKIIILNNQSRINMKKATEDSKVNLSKSWVVGDKEKDVIMGREANIKTIKIGEKMPKELKLDPNYYAKNLSDAAKIILLT